MAANTNGLIYYKLDVDKHGYPGDITKNCGLRGEEIDGNFHFLRGCDFKDVSFDENGTLYLTKNNGEILTATQTEKPEYDFDYDPETGNLTIITPTGKELVVGGFKITTNVYHDYTLEGNGLQTTPLEISNVAKTGRFRPAIKLIDTTQSESLPIENIAKHDRYVTKEKISRFGRLYSLSGVEKIAKRLADISSEWHVPSKDEWDELLNAIDCERPNHNKQEANIELGQVAGALLKSTEYWEPFHGELLSDDAYGFTIYPVGYCGNRGTKYYGSFGQSAAFWTSTVEDNYKDMFVKIFDYDKESVGQRTWGENYYLSLRLVKKFDGNNFNDSEDIDGFTHNCVHVPGTSLIWTKDNVGFAQEIYDGFSPSEWDEFENDNSVENSYDIRYFVNDWNGLSWDKHEIREGEAIVLYEGDNGRMHEWLIVDGTLVDTSVLLKEEFQKEIDTLYDKIDLETTVRAEGDRLLWEGINKEVAERKEADIALQEKINAESILREEADVVLQEKINAESILREEADNKLQTNIDVETADRQKADELEAQTREEADVLLQRHIDENKVTPENTSVVVVPGATNDNTTTPTTIKVNLPENGMIKVDEYGLYFDGDFGTF